MAAKVTEESLIEELEQARAVAEANSQSAAMVAATMGKARITGHIVDRKEVGKPGDFDSMTEEELRAFIKTNMADDKQTDRQTDVAGDSGEAQALPSPTHDDPGRVQ